MRPDDELNSGFGLTSRGFTHGNGPVHFVKGHLMASEYLKHIPKIEFEGPKTKNRMAFKHYNAEEVVAGKTMKEHLRFSVVYWHTFRNPLSDPFGVGTAARPWDDGSNSVENAQNRVRVAFELMEKLGVPFYAFHDRDVAPEGATLSETNKNLDAVVSVLKEEQQRSGIQLLWGTACLFVNPRYMHGAATSCNADAYAYAGAQVKKAMEVTLELGGRGYTFWGGREGYTTLLNTDMKRELDHLGRFLQCAVDYKKKIGFEGPFYIEPKPKEPTKHQYDSDVAACLNFLRQYNLMDHFKLNVETNHATLAGHTMHHEMEAAIAAGALGSIDANTGDTLLGWDTDQFPTDIYGTTLAMHSVLKMGGFTTGGVNFDAKVRRESFEVDDLIYAHVAGMDTFARGLKIAARLLEDQVFENFIKERYSSWESGIGQEIESGKAGFERLEAYMLEKGEATPNTSGRQELLENILNDYI